MSDDPWRGAEVVRADPAATAALPPGALPPDALLLLTRHGVPAQVEGMFYRLGDPLLAERTIGGVRWYQLGTDETGHAGVYLARHGDGQVWHTADDGVTMLFVNSSVPLFLMFLRRWHDFLEDFRDAGDDRRAVRHGRRLRRELRCADRPALRTDAAWWAYVYEEVADGVRLPGD
ncbi:SUKH-4 family immunity protein [Actinoplanes sp. NPDC023936]|uniref:SUKH-4 family immunity protein n=1 Tax=Actinoplanes sp. NPDC023936 TaxID=3154910 RepID=UPI0033E9A84A